MGSALMWSLRSWCCFLQRDVLGTLVNLHVSSQNARAYLFPQSAKIYYFCAAAPLLLTPFVRNKIHKPSKQENRWSPEEPHVSTSEASHPSQDREAKGNTKGDRGSPPLATYRACSKELDQRLRPISLLRVSLLRLLDPKLSGKFPVDLRASLIV